MSAEVLAIAKEARASVGAACRALGMSRSGVYAGRSRPPSRRSRETAALDLEVAAIHRESQRRYGSPRVQEELKARGQRVSRKRVATSMRRQNLAARRPKRFRRTTDSRHGHPVAPNVLDRRFEWSAPNEAWVGDITYIWTLEGWLYLAILVDLCTRAIVGWAVSAHCDTALALNALERAVARHRPPAGLIQHTDRGSTYTAVDYRKRLESCDMISSMSRKGNCWDNAVAESTFGTIKAELFNDRVPDSRSEATTELFLYIEAFYNRRRRHSSLGYRTPEEMEFHFQNSKKAA